MPKPWLICLVLLGLVTVSMECVSAEGVGRKAASALNTKGYRAYKAGQLSKALVLFQQSVKTDPTYGQAHYNLASTLGVLRKKEGPCGYNEVYLDDIIHSLQETLKYLPSKREKMLTDADLTPVHDTFKWQMIRGLSTDKTEDVKQILVAVAWFGPAPGAFGPDGGFNFSDKDTFTYWFLEFVNDNVVHTNVSGQFQVSGNNLTIVFDKGQARSGTFQGKLTPDGLLTFEGEGAPKGPFSDDRSDCSA